MAWVEPACLEQFMNIRSHLLTRLGRTGLVLTLGLPALATGQVATLVILNQSPGG
jgi:hypothetical protein